MRLLDVASFYVNPERLKDHYVSWSMEPMMTSEYEEIRAFIRKATASLARPIESLSSSVAELVLPQPAAGGLQEFEQAVVGLLK